MDPAANDRGVERIVVAVVVTVMVGVGVAVLAGLPPPAPPYVFVGTLREPVPVLFRGEELRVHGHVEAGSIERHGDDVRLRLGHRGVQLRVEHRGPLPDTVRDLSELVARGRLGRDDAGWVLRADQLLARCGRSYRDDRRPLDTSFK